jgi:outer membrane immunogenic protein
MRSLLVALAALGFAGSTYAADLPVKAHPAAAPAPSWTGWYVGVNGGGAWGDTKPLTGDLGPDSFFAGGNVGAVFSNASTRFSKTSGLVGGQVGYLYQSGFVILGLEASFDWMDQKGSRFNGPFLYPVTAPAGFSWNLSSKAEWLATFLSRLGYDMGNWYPYVTGGLAVSQLKYSATFIDTFYPSTSAFGTSETKAGLAIGGGIEWRFAPHWLLRGEYLYTNLGNINGRGRIACIAGVGACTGGGAPFTTQVNFTVGYTESIARAALSYQF